VETLNKGFLRRLGGNRLVLALSTARMGDAIGNSILFVIIPLYVASLPAPWMPLPQSARVGFLIALYGLVSSILQPGMGALCDRIGRRKPLILLGLFVMASATLTFVVAGRFADLILLRALQGVGAALSIPASMALMAAASTRQTRGESMGIYTTMRMAGFAIGPLIGGAIYDQFGFQSSFFAATGFIVLSMLLVVSWVDEVPRQSGAEETSRIRIFDPKMWTAGIVGTAFAALVMAVSFSMLSPLENEFNARLNQSATAFGIAFSALMVARLVSQIPVGALSDRLGRKPLIIIGLILLAPATALLGEVRTTLQLTGLRMLQGLATAGTAAPSLALAADLSRAGGEGRQMSIITMGFGLGIAVGPLMAGVLAVFFFELPFMVAGIMSLIGAWVVYRYVPETVNSK
jgi:MFS family permease